ncbi:MAG: Peptide deformylase [Candidatus Kaiserbacteria bacterium GW2011_GWC2_52_8b]|uniref:Peptide deformylase n=2 Tax=Candidatus Kaiseribacteriota TaxID=1752734 RepID=A0A0G1XKW0_9BACT|nr:MAG: Peptide deformylase [Candidatus Kaiserbacteria bacterium GW2011_GWA2_52_12]KKW31536.1 MAG: Peptide deformylase [Candidatus Kaiserbacteria bacterium GW2011_GWC2_52_8b]
MHRIVPENENPLLRKVAHAIPIGDIGSPKIKKLISEMKALLAKEKYGVALAAPQVGESLQLFIVSGKAISHNKHADKKTAIKDGKDREATPRGLNVPIPSQQDEVEADLVYINPELIKVSRGKKDKHEGCLSVRGMWGLVPRAEKATIKAHDEHGKRITRGASGFLAHVFQHETDHLHGILYTDKATEVYEEEPDEKQN